MKAMILVSIVSLLASVSMADIPAMPVKKQSAVKETAISGAAAEAVYESIAGAEQMEAGLRTMTQTYRVLRAEDGMDQVICHKTVTRMGRISTTYECEAQSSKDGNKLQVFKPSIKMG